MKRWRSWAPQWEVAHLAFDAAEVSAVAAGGEAFLKNFVEDSLMEPGPVPRGEQRRRREACDGPRGQRGGRRAGRGLHGL